MTNSFFGGVFFVVPLLFRFCSVLLPFPSAVWSWVCFCRSSALGFLPLVVCLAFGFSLGSSFLLRSFSSSLVSFWLVVLRLALRSAFCPCVAPCFGCCRSGSSCGRRPSFGCFALRLGSRSLRVYIKNKERSVLYVHTKKKTTKHKTKKHVQNLQKAINILVAFSLVAWCKAPKVQHQGNQAIRT